VHDDHGHGHHGHTHDAPEGIARAGHNRPRTGAQWQVLHDGESADGTPEPEARDLDLVEASFVEGFGRAPDPTSFLRLAGIPFVGVDAAGQRLHLLRVETESLVDIGAVAPLLGGEGVRYDPLPARLVSQRRRLTFVYHDDRGLVRLDFAAARQLKDASGASRFAVEPRS
jgi:hypothetical protein